MKTQSLRFHCNLLYSAGEVVPFKRPLLLATPYSIPSLSCYSLSRNRISEIISIFVLFWCKSSCESVQATFNSLTGQKELYWRKFNPFPTQYIRCIVKDVMDGIILNMFCKHLHILYVCNLSIFIFSIATIITYWATDFRSGKTWTGISGISRHSLT